MIQGLHVLEHVVLTGTLILTGTAHGVSTMIDDVVPVGGPTARVWFHFGINAFATAYAIAAVRAVGWRPWVAVIGRGGSDQVGADDPQSSSPQFDRPGVLHAP